MSKESILVVDDEPIIGIVFQRELGQMGYAIDNAASGEEALTAVKLKKYDLVFIDKTMPGMGGIEACRAIKKESPGSICIFMTGHFDKESTFREAQFVEAGGRTYFLYKPFAKGELSDVVKKALKEKNSL